MKRLATACLILALIPAAAAVAKDKKAGDSPPAVYQAVIDCRGVLQAGQRLACFDRTVGAMAAAKEQRELVVMDRAEVREARKGLFGLSLPKLRLLGGNDEDEKDEVKEIESTIAALRGGADGFPVFVLQDGGRWKQTDGRHVYPEVGDKIRIRRATLGSYLANVNNQPAVRVARLAN